MERVKVEDLAKEMEISKKELKMVKGGLSPQPEPPDRLAYFKIGKWPTPEWSKMRFPIETIPLPE